MSECIDNPLFTEEVPDKGAVNGHIRFTLKERTPGDVALVGFCANVTASLLFERMQAQGTNIIMRMTKENAVIDVLSRNESDGLNLIWTPKQIDPAQMSDAQERIRNKTFFIGKEAKPETKAEPKPEQKPEEKPKAETKPEAKEPADMSEAEEDYLIKQLHRIP